MLQRLKKIPTSLKAANIATVLFFGTVVMEAQLNDKIFLKDFKTQDFKKDGSNAWKMHGKNASISGGKVLLEKAITTLFSEKGMVTITTGDSNFNQNTKVWSSKDPVNIKGINLNVSGVGFVMSTSERKIHINKKVRATLTSLKDLRIKDEKQ